MRVCLFEDRGAERLEPLTLTRPVFDLLCGTTTLGDKQRAALAAAEAGALVRPHLADLVRLRQPALRVNDAAWLRAGPAVLVNGRWLPSSDPAGELASPHVGVAGDEVAYAVVEPDHLAHCSPESIDDCLEAWKATLPHHPAGGVLVRYPWELVEHNGGQIARDFRRGLGWGATRGSILTVLGPPWHLWVHPTARVEPMALADTSRGPVIIDHDAAVSAFTRLEGPCYVGPHCQVLGAKLRAGTSLGPHCRVGGEVEASVLLGYANKYHDGFLGHSYLGAWVNLGAGTQASDLRNDGGEVSVPVGGRPVATGLRKVGCFLGDHTRTGLGTLLNTGTSAGAFCNLLPGGLLPRYIPSFCSWWNGTLSDRADLHQLLQTAVGAMGRRGAELTEAHAALYRLLFDETALERRRAVREAEQRRLRRSA